MNNSKRNPTNLIQSTCLLFLCFVVAFGSQSCGARADSQRFGGETNFLKLCQRDSECDSELCACGVCTVTCEEPSACERGVAAVCSSEDPAATKLACGSVGASAAPICLPLPSLDDNDQLDAGQQPLADEAGSPGSAPNPAQSGDGDAGASETFESFVFYDVDSAGVSRDIRAVSSDGSCDKLLLGSDAHEVMPALSHSGEQLAYASNASGMFQIHVLDLAVGMDRQLTDLPTGATYPSWSPDDTEIVFVAGVGQAPGQPTGELMIANVASEATRVILSDDDAPQGSYFSPVFAGPNTVLTGNGVSLIGIDLAGLETYDVVPITGRIPNPQDPSVAPDGTRLVFSDYCGDSLQLFVSRVDGTTGDTCASALPLARAPSGVVAASWGPGGLIAAVSDGNIVVVSDDGAGEVTTLVDAPGTAHHPHFVPAGTLACP